ncbi:hypothetical protein O9G_001157 [Rozella allomycis CSF55]|uniref:F-box domain-containing protein n=1 Tax=Rozella allomycis (strain CSF55) TaxID=988480 RepID=A0A075ASF5_ROZAC|nr:hypothetical protein O9G_001157 [Rozella allomycis CSF55]|eukprot:EPZ33188.1 hypothetical protein O9G_001157 [Rozella allomycis CSF55]
MKKYYIFLCLLFSILLAIPTPSIPKKNEQVNTIKSFPAELGLMISEYLSLADSIALGVTCKAFKICYDRHIELLNFIRCSKAAIGHRDDDVFLIFNRRMLKCKIPTIKTKLYIKFNDSNDLQDFQDTFPSRENKIEAFKYFFEPASLKITNNIGISFFQGDYLLDKYVNFNYGFNEYINEDEEYKEEIRQHLNSIHFEQVLEQLMMRAEDIDLRIVSNFFGDEMYNSIVASGLSNFNIKKLKIHSVYDFFKDLEYLNLVELEVKVDYESLQSLTRVLVHKNSKVEKLKLLVSVEEKDLDLGPLFHSLPQTKRLKELLIDFCLLSKEVEMLLKHLPNSNIESLSFTVREKLKPEIQNDFFKSLGKSQIRKLKINFYPENAESFEALVSSKIHSLDFRLSIHPNVMSFKYLADLISVKKMFNSLAFYKGNIELFNYLHNLKTLSINFPVCPMETQLTFNELNSVFLSSNLKELNFQFFDKTPSDFSNFISKVLMSNIQKFSVKIMSSTFYDNAQEDIIDEKDDLISIVQQVFQNIQSSKLHFVQFYINVNMADVAQSFVIFFKGLELSGYSITFGVNDNCCFTFDEFNQILLNDDDLTTISVTISKVVQLLY